MKKMKKIMFVLMVLFTTITILAQTKKINVTKSVITWTGKKVTGEHQGTLNFKEGSLIFKNNKLVGGNLVADMSTMVCTSVTGKDKTKLEGHLKSTDFFDTEGSKTSTLVFTSVVEKKPNIYGVTADLSIKGKTNPVKFDLSITGKTAVANLTIDRTKYGIQYGSGSFFDDLGDKTIYDNFDLRVSLFY